MKRTAKSAPSAAGAIQVISTITCPRCKHRASETMPANACQFFYICRGCGARLKPIPGDCCVFCSYGDVPCIPVQSARMSGSQNGCCDATT